jgi:hypothetical protein
MTNYFRAEVRGISRDSHCWADLEPTLDSSGTAATVQTSAKVHEPFDSILQDTIRRRAGAFPRPRSGRRKYPRRWDWERHETAQSIEPFGIDLSERQTLLLHQLQKQKQQEASVRTPRSFPIQHLQSSPPPLSVSCCRISGLGSSMGPTLLTFKAPFLSLPDAWKQWIHTVHLSQA